jgi:hypothetical protein
MVEGTHAHNDVRCAITNSYMSVSWHLTYKLYKTVYKSVYKTVYK